MNSKVSNKVNQNNLVSLNIKIKKDLDLRLKRARKIARENKEMFNVSEIVSEFLNEKLLEFEIKNNINHQEFDPNQITIFD